MKKMKKLDLNKAKISGLTRADLSKTKGGIFNSHVMCFTSDYSTNCTKISQCTNGGSGVTIICL